MIRFLVDTQLPPKLASYLMSKGFDSIHTTFFENGHLLQDKEISEIAINENRVIITKDNDFFERFIINGAPPKVLLLHFGNIRNKDLLQHFEHQLETINKLFGKGDDLLIVSDRQVISY